MERQTGFGLSCSVSGTLVILGWGLFISGCAGLQSGEPVSRQNRLLSDPNSFSATVTIESAQVPHPIHTRQRPKAIVKDAKIAIPEEGPEQRLLGTSVQTDRSLQEQSRTRIVVTGLAALMLDVTDNPDPIEVGHVTTYTIVMTNRGTAPATNVRISATIPEGMDYESSTGSTGRLVVFGRQVDFDPIPSLRPKKSVTYTIQVRGTNSGDLRFQVSMTADQLTTPVLKEETTTLYQ